MNCLTLKIGTVEGLPHLAWASDLTVTLPEPLANHLLAQCHYQKDQKLHLSQKIFNEETGMLAKKAMTALRLHAAMTNKQPLSSRLPINYQFIPSRMRDLVAQFIGRKKRSQQDRWAQFPRWPLDLSADFAADLANPASPDAIDRKTPVFLTHDLDSLEGLQNVVRYFLDSEEAVGARSANYVVPAAWQIDHGLLCELKNRGHEVGIHGFDHSNKTPFLPPQERQRRLAAALPLIEQYQISGYRAPSLLRTQGLLKDLAAFYQYDSSIPTSGGLFPVPNNGCASARPFQIEGIWELPLSMPRDGSLQFLGYTPQEILDTWIACANRIAQSGGIVNLLTHCEYRFSGKPRMLEVYKAFLAYLAHSGKFTFTLPRDFLTVTETKTDESSNV